MSLNKTLNTNEVKDAAAAEVEFQQIASTSRSATYAKIAEVPNLPYRLTISHQETGAGLKMRRRSLLRFDKTVMSGVDTTLPITVSAYVVLDAPVGAMSAITEAANVLANIMSFLSTTGAGTTVLFDGTGNGAATLLTGGL